jgi:hypothetical protein
MQQILARQRERVAAEKAAKAALEAEAAAGKAGVEADGEVAAAPVVVSAAATETRSDKTSKLPSVLSNHHQADLNSCRPFHPDSRHRRRPSHSSRAPGNGRDLGRRTTLSCQRCHFISRGTDHRETRLGSVTSDRRTSCNTSRSSRQ